MEMILQQQRLGKVMIVSILLFVIFIIISLIRLVVGSYFVAFVIFLGLVWFLLRSFGSFVMYPGSFFYTRSDIQIRFSKEIMSRIVVVFNALSFLSHCIMKKKYNSHQNEYDLTVNITKHVQMMIEMLSMFEGSLSERKTNILAIYRELSDIIESKSSDDGRSIANFILKPRAIEQINSDQLAFFQNKFKRLGVLYKQLIAHLKFYTPPTQMIQSLKFRLYHQSLYEIRFGFYNWKNLFQYELHTVKTQDNIQIQTAIVHRQIVTNPYYQINNTVKPINSDPKKAILFCNPNGVFIQFFGADNEYIKNYLKLGYKVIMWNYRGYGQSTGKPTITNSQSDAFSVFMHYKKLNYDIKLVHGYSIGGTSAIGMMTKLSQSSLPEEEIKKVEVLIVDRSFSSIGEMSIQFGDTLHKLTKIIFFGDNMDLSKQFEDLRCSKLLIWDFSDEVIPDRASIKNRIIKRKNKKATQKSIYGCDEENEGEQLNEEVASVIQFQDIAHKLSKTVEMILVYKVSVGSEERETMDFMKDQEREVSMQTSASDNDYNPLQSLMKTMNRVDGGGIEIFRNAGELLKILQNKREYFLHICESYVLGLVCYGSYFPLKPIIHNHLKIKQQTLIKIQNNMKELKDKYHINPNEAELLYSQQQQSYQQLAKNMYYIYHKLSQMVTDYYSEQWFAKHGSLLPTNNGHNCSLNDEEQLTMNEFIRNSIGEIQLKEVEAMSEQQLC